MRGQRRPRRGKSVPADVLLLYLPVSFGAGKRYGLPPIGVYQLAANLSRAGITAKVLDASIRGLSLDETVRQVKRYAPGLVGISALTPHLPSITLLVGALNSVGYKGKIIVGGPHFNVTKEEYLTTSGADLDYVMYSESDTSFVTFCQEYFGKRVFTNVPNLVRREGNEIIVNPIGAFVEDLETLPFPDLGAGDPADYQMVYGRYDRAHSIMCSRGCPYLCSFCDVFSVWGRKLRSRSPKNVVDELQFNLERHNIREFFFKDSTFTVNYKWTYALIDELKKRKLPVNWHCNTRVDRVNKEMLKAMKDVGLRGIYYGVESGNQEILDSIRKKITVAQVKQAFKDTDDLGIQANAFFMVGNPGETLATAQDSLNLALQIPATLVGVAPTVAYPGTESYEVGLKAGLLKDPKWYLRHTEGEKQFLSVSAEVCAGQYDLPGFSPQQQIAFCKKFNRKFFLRPSTLWRIFCRYSSLQLLRRAIAFAPTFLAFVYSKSETANHDRWTTGEHAIGHAD
jgi:anaerobic magnesium-protoporphyrin IX monomethyl ester cyclase